MLEFFFEFASTYSYPAAMRIEGLARTKGVEVNWRPFLLGPIFKDQQGLLDSPFNAVPAKGAYMWRDMQRICETEGLPFQRPGVFPQNGLLAARIALGLPESERPDFVRAVYMANFCSGADISDPETLGQAAGKSCEDIVRLAGQPQQKAALRNNTEEAAKRGVFGAPTFFAPDGEMFWGNDRLDAAIEWTRKIKNNNADKIEKEDAR